MLFLQVNGFFFLHHHKQHLKTEIFSHWINSLLLNNPNFKERLQSFEQTICSKYDQRKHFWTELYIMLQKTSTVQLI